MAAFGSRVRCPPWSGLRACPRPGPICSTPFPTSRRWSWPCSGGEWIAELADAVARINRLDPGARPATGHGGRLGEGDMPIDATLPYDDSNIFARILRGEIPAKKVYED